MNLDLPAGRRSPPSRWRVLLICFLAQNLAMGFAFGSFGPLLDSNQQAFGVSRGAVAAGMGLMMLVIGLLSPFAGNLLQRVPVRAAMVLGALLGGAGYWGLAAATSFQRALLMYGLIGVSVCLCAILGPLILVSRWFEAHRGKYLALVNVPLVLFVTPYLVGLLLPLYGRTTVYAAMGTALLLLVPLLFLLAEAPAKPTHQASGARTVSMPESTASILKRPAFWLLSVGIGLMAGSGTAFMVHMVPFGTAKQMSLQSASALLSVYAGAGIGGTLLFGWICDRLGPPFALVVSAFAQALLWWATLHVDVTMLYVVSALLGTCVVPTTTLHGAALSQTFSAASVSRAMGFSYSIKLPFIFAFAPTVGLLFDRLGSYVVPFSVTAGLLALAGLSFCGMALALRRPSASRVPAVGA